MLFVQGIFPYPSIPDKAYEVTLVIRKSCNDSNFGMFGILKVSKLNTISLWKSKKTTGIRAA